MVVNLIVPVYAQGEYIVFPETASVSSSADVAPFKFMLKAISKPSGEVEKVSGFKIDPVNVLSVSEGGTISPVSTDESMVFEQAKATSSSDSLYELQKATATTQGQQSESPQSISGFSIAGLVPGVYTLDLIGTKNGAKAAYEGILVIGQNTESPQVKQVVEKEVNEGEQDTTIIDIVTIFQTPPPIPLQQQQTPQGQSQPGAPPQTLAAGQQQPPQSGPPQTLGSGQQQPSTQSTGPIAQQLPPGGAEAGMQPLAAQPQPQQQLTTPAGNGQQNVTISGQCGQNPDLPECQQAGDIPLALLGAESCEDGFEGTPPQCSPIEPGNEPVDPNDSLLRDTGETGDGDETKDSGDSGDTGTEDSESNSENEEEGDGDEDEE